MRSAPADARVDARSLDAAALRAWPLPSVDGDGDKESRGAVLVVGGASTTPGAVLLAGTAALRAGAGKLQMATVKSTAAPLAVAVPEAMVLALDESDNGNIHASAAAHIVEHASRVDALCIGPGLFASEHTTSLVRDVLAGVHAPSVVLDAAAMDVLRAAPDALRALDGRAVLTPHAGEMAHLLDIDKERVIEDALALARRTAAECFAVVVLKGSETIVATPDGSAWRYTRGDAGLATSGSGDVLAGVVTGLLARGASAAQAAVWGVWLHGEAGRVLAARSGRIGFLARELAAEVPALMQHLTKG